MENICRYNRLTKEYNYKQHNGIYMVYTSKSLGGLHTKSQVICNSEYFLSSGGVTKK
jgi:hypothetical protein